MSRRRHTNIPMPMQNIHMESPFETYDIIHYDHIRNSLITLEIQSYRKLRLFGGWQQIDKVVLDGDVLGEIRTRSVGNKLEVTTHVNGHSVPGNNIEFLLKARERQLDRLFG